MRDWKNIEDRRQATLLFVSALNDDPQLREKCINSSDAARETFARVGEFTSIPHDVVFHGDGGKQPRTRQDYNIFLPNRGVDPVSLPVQNILGCTR